MTIYTNLAVMGKMYLCLLQYQTVLPIVLKEKITDIFSEMLLILP